MILFPENLVFPTQQKNGGNYPMFAKLGYYICVPFAFLTRLFYSWTGSYGVALILFTLVVKLVLLPFQLKSKKSMLRMNRMQGKLNDIKTRYANNQQKQQEAMAELYAKEGINPMSGCLWSMIPFPILIALYYIIRVPLRYFMSLSESVIAEITTLAGTLGFTAAEGSQAYEQIYLAKFIHEHWADFAGKFDGLIDLNYNFLHIDLAAQPSSLFSQFPGGGWPVWGALLLPIISAGIQFAMSFITMRTNGSAPNGSTKTMMYMMPLMTLWMGYILPSALCIYWIANSAFSLIQEVTLNKYFNKILDREETEKEKAAREKRYAKYQRQKELMAQQQLANGGKKPQNQQGKKKPSGDKKKSAGGNENGRVGQRPYARGRAYDKSHYDD
jgi:YidC/Oxa1 family membrane protein insertase